MSDWSAAGKGRDSGRWEWTATGSLSCHEEPWTGAPGQAFLASALASLGLPLAAVS